MFPISATSRLIRDVVVAVSLAPIAVEAIRLCVVSREIRSAVPARAVWLVRLTAVCFAAWLAMVVTPPATDGANTTDLAAAIQEATRMHDPRGLELARLAVQQNVRNEALPSEALETLLRARRVDEMQRYAGARLSGSVAVDSAAELVLLAKSVRLSGGGALPGADRVVRDARTRPDLASAAELLAATITSPPPTDDELPAMLFAGGRRIQGGVTPLAALRGFSARDAGDGHCDIIVYFRPRTSFRGDRLWLHEYPRGAHEYADIGAWLPPSDWREGEFGWEVFRSVAPGDFVLYGGVSDDQGLGPAVALGEVARCAAPVASR